MDEKKKLKELATLHKIYYGNDYEITPSESPDFLVYKKVIKAMPELNLLSYI